MSGLVAFFGKISLLVGVGGTWQLYLVCQHVARLYGVLTVEGKLPCPAEIDTFRGVVCHRMQAY